MNVGDKDCNMYSILSPLYVMQMCKIFLLSLSVTLL